MTTNQYFVEFSTVLASSGITHHILPSAGSTPGASLSITMQAFPLYCPFFSISTARGISGIPWKTLFSSLMSCLTTAYNISWISACEAMNDPFSLISLKITSWNGRATSSIYEHNISNTTTLAGIGLPARLAPLSHAVW